MGSAYWSDVEPPIPYPYLLVPAFGWLLMTTIQTCLHAEALLIGTLLDGIFHLFSPLYGLVG
jgi:hypothetical protein